MEFKENDVKYKYRDFDSYIQLSFSSFPTEFQTKEYIKFWIQLDDIKEALILVVKVKFEVTRTGEKMLTLMSIRIKSIKRRFSINKRKPKGIIRPTDFYLEDISKLLNPEYHISIMLKNLGIAQPSEKAGPTSGTVAKGAVCAERTVAKSGSRAVTSITAVSSAVSAVPEVSGIVIISKRMTSDFSQNVAASPNSAGNVFDKQSKVFISTFIPDLSLREFSCNLHFEIRTIKNEKFGVFVASNVKFEVSENYHMDFTNEKGEVGFVSKEEMTNSEK